MKVPKTFVPENNERLEDKTKDYLNMVEYVQKPYNEEELGIGATVIVPEMFLDEAGKALEETFKKKITDSIKGAYTKDYEKFKGLSVEEIEKKILEDYTVVQ